MLADRELGQLEAKFGWTLQTVSEGSLALEAGRQRTAGEPAQTGPGKQASRDGRGCRNRDWRTGGARIGDCAEAIAGREGP